MIEAVEPLATTEVVHSLFLKENYKLKPVDFFDTVKRYKYEEQLPLTLNEVTNQYELSSFMATNYHVTPLKAENIYRCMDQVIDFF